MVKKKYTFTELIRNFIPLLIMISSGLYLFCTYKVVKIIN